MQPCSGKANKPPVCSRTMNHLITLHISVKVVASSSSKHKEVAPRSLSLPRSRVRMNMFPPFPRITKHLAGQDMKGQTTWAATQMQKKRSGSSSPPLHTAGIIIYLVRTCEQHTCTHTRALPRFASQTPLCAHSYVFTFVLRDGYYCWAELFFSFCSVLFPRQHVFLPLLCARRARAPASALKRLFSFCELQISHKEPTERWGYRQRRSIVAAKWPSQMNVRWCAFDR